MALDGTQESDLISKPRSTSEAGSPPRIEGRQHFDAEIACSATILGAPLPFRVRSVDFPLQANVGLTPKSVEKRRHWQPRFPRVKGSANALPFGPRSDFGLRRNGKSIVDIDAKVSNCALNLRVPKQ